MTEVTQTHLAQNANDHGIFGLEPITKWLAAFLFLELKGTGLS